MSKHRNSRLRKKLHLDEFVEYGFEVKYGCPKESEMDFLVILSKEVLTPRNMVFGYEDAGQVFISGLFGSLSEEDHNIMKTWIGSQSFLSSSDIGPLVDAWHPPRGVRYFGRHRGQTIGVINPCETL